MIKLVVTDLDGTLLNSDSQMPKEIHDVISSLTSVGIRFVVASGRQINNLRRLFNDRLDIFYIAQNGAHVEYGDKALYQQPIDDEDVRSIIQKADTFGLYPMIYTKDTIYVKDTDPSFIERLNNYDLDYKVVNEFAPNCDVEKISLMSLDDEAKEYKNRFLSIEGVSVCISHKDLLDVTRWDVSKGSALALLQENLNISVDMTMAFGDAENDLTLFEHSYYSFAMRNASEEVKKKARFIASGNDENGVIQVLMNIDKYTTRDK